MGFRSGTYATVWSAESISPAFTKCRISISRKNRQTGEYEQDFSGFVGFLGSACAQKALGLKEKDRIRIGDVDVSNRYDKEKRKEYTDFKVFSFDMADDVTPGQQNTQNNAVDSGEVEEDELPF